MCIEKAKQQESEHNYGQSQRIYESGIVRWQFTHKALFSSSRAGVEIDLEVLHEVARFATKYTPFGARYGLLQIVRELENSLRQELDFRVEAENTKLISKQIADFSLLTTPSVYNDFTSRLSL